jgi:hypothetical protein
MDESLRDELIPASMTQAATAPGELARRVTPLTVVADLTETVATYLALGFEQVDSGDAGCVGLRAGGTYHVVATKAHMERQFSPLTVALLMDRTTPYVYVTSLDEAKARLSPVAAVVEQAAATGGVREAVVETDGQLLVLAEKLD